MKRVLLAILSLVLVLSLYAFSQADEEKTELWFGNFHALFPAEWHITMQDKDLTSLSTEDNRMLTIVGYAPDTGYYYKNFDAVFKQIFTANKENLSKISEYSKVESNNTYSVYKYNGAYASISVNVAVFISKYYAIEVSYADLSNYLEDHDATFDALIKCINYDTIRSFELADGQIYVEFDENEYEIIMPDNIEHTLTLAQNGIDKQYVDHWFASYSHADVILYKKGSLFQFPSYSIIVDEGEYPGISVVNDGRVISPDKAKSLFKQYSNINNYDVTTINNIPFMHVEGKMFANAYQDVYLTFINSSLVKIYSISSDVDQHNDDMGNLEKIIRSIEFLGISQNIATDSKRMFSFSEVGMTFEIDEGKYDILVADNLKGSQTLIRNNLSKEEADQYWEDISTDGTVAWIAPAGTIQKFDLNCSLMIIDYDVDGYDFSKLNYTDFMEWVGIFTEDGEEFLGTESINGALYLVIKEDKITHSYRSLITMVDGKLIWIDVTNWIPNSEEDIELMMDVAKGIGFQG